MDTASRSISTPNGRTATASTTRSRFKRHPRQSCGRSVPCAKRGIRPAGRPESTQTATSDACGPDDRSENHGPIAQRLVHAAARVHDVGGFLTVDLNVIKRQRGGGLPPRHRGGRMTHQGRRQPLRLVHADRSGGRNCGDSVTLGDCQRSWIEDAQHRPWLRSVHGRRSDGSPHGQCDALIRHAGHDDGFGADGRERRRQTVR